MAATSLHPMLLICCLSLSLSPLISARNHRQPSSVSQMAKDEVLRMMKAFNLSPQKDVNIIKDDQREPAPRLVENPFVFPHLADAENGTSVEEFGHHAGYFTLNNTVGGRMFYFFFESRTKNASAPVVVWLTGGPGCSGSLALFTENGPFKIINGSLSLEWNPFGWDQESNLIYVDQPIGTGFSYSSSLKDFRRSTYEAAPDFFNFLQAFFVKHPEYAKNDFYLTGESYAGHYIPAFASEIQKQNKNKGASIPINLKGIAIGDGLTNRGVQDQANPEYALAMKLITKEQHDNLTQEASECAEGLKSCSTTNGSTSVCITAYNVCNRAFGELISYIPPNTNIYDIRKKCEGTLCYDFTGVEKFLNDASVKKALGVADIKWISCSVAVYDFMYVDIFRDYSVVVPSLLEDGVKVLIYVGEYDLVCNWIGNSRWVDGLEWPGQKNYLAANSTEFVVGNEKHGLTKNEGPLTFLKVYNAGHLVPMDQPQASLQMLKRWMQGVPL